MSDTHIRVQRDGAVLSVALCRRDKKNAITTAMYDSMSDAFDRADRDADIAAVLLHGDADLFTSGNDLNDFLSADARTKGSGQRFLRSISGLSKPLVAAVGGPAIGVGCTMLMHCDLVVAARHARFQLPFVSLGLSPEGASSQLLPLMAGPRVAAELLMLGDTFDATRAREIGLVNWVVDDNQLLPFAHEIATRLANQPADALRTTKRLLQRSWARTVSEVLDDERPEFERLLHSPAARSVFQAFLDKRSG